MAYPSPYHTFKYAYLVTHTKTSGDGFVSYYSVGQAYKGNFTVYDNINNSYVNGSGKTVTDSNAQLGDVNGDQFHVQSTQLGGKDTATYAGVEYNPTTMDDDPSLIVAYANGFKDVAFSDQPLAGQKTIEIDADPYTIACFASGTAIRTARGDVAVEALAIGDLAITASGEARPIRWIGRRRLDCAAHRNPAMARPICVSAGAFGGGRPYRDLLLSPHHAVAVSCVGEVLVPIRLLANGTTIRQIDDVAEVTYWHVELDDHDVILANGLPAESYIDVGNRCDFEGEASLTLHPEFGSEAIAGYCRPLVTGGAVLAAIRAQLAEPVRPAAVAPAEEFEFHLLVAGERIDPVVRDREAAFLVPEGAGDVRLVSSSFSPREIDPASRDDRRLGVMIETLSVGDLFGGFETVPLDGTALVAGFHPLEQERGGVWRWTDGDALLSASLFAGRAGPCLLRLTGPLDLPARERPAKRLAA